MRQHAGGGYPLIFILAVFLMFTAWGELPAQAQNKTASPVFIRFKVIEPAGNRFSVGIGGSIHSGEPWALPNKVIEAAGGVWSEWIDLSDYPWHGKVNRSGGIAEYAAIRLSLTRLDPGDAPGGAGFNVELADKPDEKSVVISFAEKSQSNSIGFLVPFPLRENAKDFETGSQMTDRHARWAKEAVAAVGGASRVQLKKFDITTTIWGHYDPVLARQEALTLRLLGFNVVHGISPSTAIETGLRRYGHTWLYEPDPESVSRQWTAFAESSLKGTPQTEQHGQWNYKAVPFWVISDEVSGLDFRYVEKAKLNGWFRTFLRSRQLKDADFDRPIDQIEYPAAAMHEKTLPHDAPIPTRRLMYYAAKFGHWWSARQLRQISDLIQGSLPEVKTETLLPSHGFLGNAWGPAHIGMSYRMLDIFELGAQQSVTRVSAEDWLGLNHMYGPAYTWSGGQTFGYYNAILRSAIGDRPMLLGGLITPSDDEYLQLKAYSSLGQGAKSFFFWTFGPTYIGTENYWSDLQSEYHGIAKLNRALQQSEDVLYPAKTESDPVAIFYSVSHDLWNTNNHSAFAEKRFLWHALRHLNVQPNFLREEDVEAGKLKNYKALYLTDWCLSRRASAAIDEWVKNGGVLYLSAGAATRDEFYEPYSPAFSAAVWGEGAAEKLITERHAYNERTDLPKIKPLTTAAINLNGQQFDLPVIGNRLEMRPNPAAGQFAVFADGKAAGQTFPYGRGKIIGVGFMPMLAYGRLANFKPVTLEEKWQPEPRAIVKTALDAAGIVPIVKTDVPVVEANLLTGPAGSALVLVNYTYQPIDSLTVDLKLAGTVKQAVSTQGSPVQLQAAAAAAAGQTPGQVRLKVPLKSVDIILLK